MNEERIVKETSRILAQASETLRQAGVPQTPAARQRHLEGRLERFLSGACDSDGVVRRPLIFFRNTQFIR
jgi:hypothetical protein